MDPNLLRAVEKKWRLLLSEALAAPTVRPASHALTRIEAELYLWIQFYELKAAVHLERPADQARVSMMCQQLILIDFAHALSELARQQPEVEVLPLGSERLKIVNRVGGSRLVVAVRPHLHPMAPGGFWFKDPTYEPDLSERFVAPVLAKASATDVIDILNDELLRRYLGPRR